MISKDSKFHSCKDPIQATIHQPIQIRTNKHRCFVFCIGHTSLTCVPGIGKKNKYLLNQSGINDLSTLYSKYRSINNIQHFKQWLQNDIGFTSYQAKMTTCGIGSKLGEIKEINTGLTPICCPSKKRNRNSQSKNAKNKEEGIKKRKIENVSPSSNQDQTSSSSEEKPMNKLSDHYLTGVKSPDNPIFAIRPPSMKNKDESDPSSSPNKFSLDRKYEPNEISKTKPMKFDSSSMINETTRGYTNSLEAAKQDSPSLEKNSQSNMHSSKLSPSPSEQLKKNQTPDEIREMLSTIKPFNNSPKVNSEMKHEIQPKKSSLDKRASNEIFNDQMKTHPSSISPSYDKITTLNSTKDEKLNEIFTLTKQKLQPTLDALQDKKDELLSASKKSPDSSIVNEYPKKSILRSTPSTSISQVHTNILLAAIKQQQQTKNKPFKITPSSEMNQIKTAISDGIDSNIKSKSDERSPNESDNKSISSIKRSYASLPRSTPAVFPIKSKSMKKSDISSSIKLTPENNLTPLDSKFNVTNISSPVTSSGSSPTTDKLTPKTFNPPSTIMEESWQESIFNRYDSSFNESQQKFREEISKTVSQIMKQAAHIANEDIQPSQINSTSSRKVNSKESFSIQTPISETKNHNDTGQSITSPLKQDDEQRNTPSKCIPLAERLAQAKAKNLVTLMESKKKEINQFENDQTNDPMPSSNTGNEVSNDQGSNAENKSIKQSSITNKQINNDRLQQEQSNLIPKLPSSTNKSSESMKIKPSNEKKSMSTLSSLSDSNQSINRINSSIDNIQSSCSNINRFEKEIETETNNDSEKFNDIIMSTNKNKAESISSPIAEDLTLFNYHKKDKLNTPIISSNRINQLSLSQDIKENQMINKNLSETINSKENSERKHEIYDNHELKINSNSTDSKHQSKSSPSSPIPCNALWDNISNEKILSQRKTHRFTLIKKNRSDQKINQNDYNQNHHSSTTLFTFLTQQQYLKERQALNEHILYTKRIKTLYKK